VVPFVSNVAGGVSNTVGVSPAWQTYHIPIIGVSCFVVGILGTLLVGSLWSWVKLKLFQRKQPKEYMGEPEYVPPSVLPQELTSTTVKVAEAAKAIETPSTPKEETVEQVEAKE